MDLPTYGRHLVELLAERSLEKLRGASLDDVRKLMNGGLPSSVRGTMQVGAALGAFAAGAAVGAGITALTTPTTGPELRKKIAGSTRGARKQARQLGRSVRAHVEEARESIAHGVEQLVGAHDEASAQPAHPRSRGSNTKRRSNGHTKRSTTRAQV